MSLALLRSNGWSISHCQGWLPSGGTHHEPAGGGLVGVVPVVVVVVVVAVGYGSGSLESVVTGSEVWVEGSVWSAGSLRPPHRPWPVWAGMQRSTSPVLVLFSTARRRPAQLTWED